MKEKIKEVKKIWGKEKWLVNNDKYCGKLMTLEPGYQCSLHFHKDKQETFYILEGILELTLLDLETTFHYTEVLKSGEAYTILPLQPHIFKANNGRCKFLEVSTPHSDKDVYRIFKSKKIN